jgi:hypothetical protein
MNILVIDGDGMPVPVLSPARRNALQIPSCPTTTQATLVAAVSRARALPLAPHRLQLQLPSSRSPDARHGSAEAPD